MNLSNDVSEKKASESQATSQTRSLVAQGQLTSAALSPTPFLLPFLNLQDSLRHSARYQKQVRTGTDIPLHMASPVRP